MNKEIQNISHNSSKVRDMVICSLLIALVFIATKFINIRLPISINGGLIHMGNVMLFISAIVFGKKKGAIAGAFGMGLFDILSGWAAWAPFTFIIRGAMGYVVGSISNAHNRNGENQLYNIIAVCISSVLMIFGYYITEVILYGNWLSPVSSIPGNIAQLLVGAVIGLPAASAIKKSKVI
ncbi:MAG: transporter component [Clostridiaceae bacterium]|nr:transporter component [Clostridiaceae bacterium]